MLDLPEDDGVHYMPMNPSDWGWIVASWIVSRVAEHLVEDADAVAKRTIADLRRQYSKAHITLLGPDGRAIDSRSQYGARG